MADEKDLASVTSQLKHAEERIAELLKTGTKDPAQRMAELEKHELRRREIIARADLQWVLSDPRGRRTVLRILAESKPYGASFDPKSERITSFNEGRRDVGLWLMERLNVADANAYAQMLREHASDLKSDEARIAKLKEDYGVQGI